MITAVRRLLDGLLADIQMCPAFPKEEEPRLKNATAQFGGALDDWELMEIPPNVWPADYNPKARQFWFKGYTFIGVTQSTPPGLSASKNTVQADGTDTVTITANVGDVTCTDVIRWTVQAPDGSTITGEENMVGGESTLELQTTALGAHTITVETEQFGLAALNIEGI